MDFVPIDFTASGGRGEQAWSSSRGSLCRCRVERAVRSHSLRAWAIGRAQMAIPSRECTLLTSYHYNTGTIMMDPSRETDVAYREEPRGSLLTGMPLAADSEFVVLRTTWPLGAHTLIATSHASQRDSGPRHAPIELAALTGAANTEFLPADAVGDGSRLSPRQSR